MMIIIKLRIIYDFLTLPLFVFSFFIKFPPKWLKEVVFFKIVPPVIFIILPHSPQEI